jgi:hypothetical protein
MRSWLWPTLGAALSGVIGWTEVGAVDEEWRMARRRRDDDGFDQRLENEIMTDAKPDELWIGWYYYFDDHLGLPFKARCIAERPTSPLQVGEVVEVRSMPTEDVCEHDMFVNIRWQDRLLAVPWFNWRELLSMKELSRRSRIGTRGWRVNMFVGAVQT